MRSHNHYLEDAMEEAYNEMYAHQLNKQFEINHGDPLGIIKDDVITNDGELISLNRYKNTNAPNYSSGGYLIRNRSDKIIGMLTITDEGNGEIQIKSLNINPLYTNNGYTQSLFRVLIYKLIPIGCKSISLRIPDKPDKAFLHILNKFGFYKRDETFMEMSLLDYDETAFARENNVFYLNAITEAGKEGVYKENYIFRDKLQKPIVSPVLSKRNNRNKIIDFVGEFIDKHNKELSTSGPVYTFTFGTKQLEPIYELFGIDDKFLIDLYVEMVEDTYNGKISKFFSGWVKAAPHKILLNAMMAEAIQQGYDDILECCEYMWAFTEYPILYRKYWSTGVKEDVMNYTIEHLGSKHKIKHFKTILELLKYDANTATKAFIEKLKTAPDNVYMDLIYRMRNQFNSKLRNINNYYYKNSELDLTQHTNVVQFDDGEMADQEGHASNTAFIINRTISKFSTTEINNSFLKIAAEKNQVDKNNLSNFISQICSSKDNKIPKFIENVLTYYFEKNPRNSGISPSEFLNFGLALYRSIGTSKSQILQELKYIVNVRWMEEIVDIRSQYQREATIIAYTRGVFDYMIFMISYYNN